MYMHIKPGNAKRRMVHVPLLDGISLHATIETSTLATSLLKCAVLCDIGDMCDTIYYNESTSLCIQVYDQTENPEVHDGITGTVYKTKGRTTYLSFWNYMNNEIRKHLKY